MYKKIIDVKFVHLLLLYMIIPLALIVVWIDQTLLHSKILISSPFKPEEWIIWVYIFGMPHVITGAQMFADTEYIKMYGWRLFRILAICLALPLVVVPVFGAEYMFVIFMAFIVYHTVAQQFGLTLAVLKKAPTTAFYAWKWSAIGVGSVLYLMLYFAPIPLAYVNNEWKDLLVLSAKVLLAITVLSGIAVIWENRTNKLGSWYVGLNIALIFTECFLFYMHYFFLIVILGRIIHEFTAWPIYIAHENNRNLTVKHNWIYRMFGDFIPITILSVALAFAIGFALLYITKLLPFFASVIISLSIYHFYTEHFLWRRDGILRESVKFV